MKIKICILLLLSGMMVAALQSADLAKRDLREAVYWADETGQTRAVLVKEEPTRYTLILTDGGNYEVFYRTAVNTIKKVRRKCEEEKSESPQVRYFSIRHSFSRTTIWMGLEFVKDGTVDHPPHRTFHGGIRENRTP